MTLFIGVLMFVAPILLILSLFVAMFVLRSLFFIILLATTLVFLAVEFFGFVLMISFFFTILLIVVTFPFLFSPLKMLFTYCIPAACWKLYISYYAQSS